MAKSKMISRQPDTIISIGRIPVATIQVKQLKKKIYSCDLLDGDGNILKADHPWARGKQPFKDLSAAELKSLKPDPPDESPAAGD